MMTARGAYYLSLIPSVHYNSAWDPGNHSDVMATCQRYAIVDSFAIVSLLSWTTLLDFIKEHPEYVAPDNAMGFLSQNGGETYSTCHCEPSAFSPSFADWNYVPSLEQLRNRRYGFLARPCIYCILQVPRLHRRVLLWGMCSSCVSLLILSMLMRHSVGEMHRYIALPPGYSLGRSKFIFLKR